MTVQSNNSNYPSGCVGSCKYDHKQDKCLGCGRSMAEIREAYRQSQNGKVRL